MGGERGEGLQVCASIELLVTIISHKDTARLEGEFAIELEKKEEEDG